MRMLSAKEHCTWIGIAVAASLCLACPALAGATPLAGRTAGSQAAEADRPLIELLRERDGRERAAEWPISTRMPAAIAVESGSQADVRGDSERIDFGKFDMGVGRLSVVSRELDQFGRIEDVSVFKFESNSRWDMDLEVDDGAMFQFSRSFGSGAGRPFVDPNKDRWRLH